MTQQKSHRYMSTDKPFRSGTNKSINLEIVVNDNLSNKLVSCQILCVLEYRIKSLSLSILVDNYNIKGDKDNLQSGNLHP